MAAGCQRKLWNLQQRCDKEEEEEELRHIFGRFGITVKWPRHGCMQLFLYLYVHSVDDSTLMSTFDQFRFSFVVLGCQTLELKNEEHHKQTCLQHSTSADYVILLAFAAAHRAAVTPLLLGTGRAAIDPYLLPATPTAVHRWDRQTEILTDTIPLHRPSSIQ